ncbi:MAG TPA: OmpA family protein [Pseudomonadales bacterium]|nr:OmpA family protein [Pseudomonadales bacterium]
MKIRTHGIASMAALAAVLLVGCTTDPYTGQPQVSRTAVGAAIGAAAGAAAGAVTTDSSRERRKRALIGAGVGALAGGAVGGYMDAQERLLRQELASTGVSVTRDGDRLILNMPGNVTFATGSASISSDFYPVLDSVAKVLDEYSKTIIDVAGHTDSTGAADFNQDLSERRASSVGSYLLSRQIDSRRIITRGYGETMPVATNETDAGRQANRRVELVLEPIVSG